MKNPHYTKKGPGRKHDNVTMEEKLEYLRSQPASVMAPIIATVAMPRRVTRDAILRAARS